MNVAVAQRRTVGLPRWSTGNWVIARHVARRAQLVAAIWGLVFGLYVIATIEGFVKGFPTHDQRVQAVHSLQSFAMLLGPLRRADTVAGFTSWRVLTAIAFIGAIWGLLTSTGLLRGEEDAGRWELFLAGQTTKRRAAAQALVGLGSALATMFSVTAVVTILAGRLPAAHFSVGAALFFAAALVSGGAMFLAIGALTSQLSATRGQSATIAAAVLGAAYVVRVFADSSNALGWLRWLTPLGWIEELRPLADPQPMALIPIVVCVLACAGLTILLAGRRDLNASLVHESEGRLGETRWLRGPTSLALRLSRPAALAWLAGIIAFSVLFGSVARSTVSVLGSSPAFTAALGRLGVHAATEGYLSFALFLVDVLIAVFAATQIGAIRDEEAAGRLDNLLCRPVPRARWLGGRLFVSVCVVVLAGLLAGFGTWLGATTHHTYAPLPNLLAAGVNATIPGVFVLGAGALVFGVRPRFSAVAAYGVVAWSFLIDLIGSLIKGLDWLRDSSVFTHLKLAPATNPDWATATVIILLGVGMAALGLVAFQKRDIEYA